MTIEGSHTVISGVPYPVLPPAGGTPPALGSFVGQTEFTVDMAGHPYLVRGSGFEENGHVRFYEKEHMVGRDIRVWHVLSHDAGFTAEHVSDF